MRQNRKLITITLSLILDSFSFDLVDLEDFKQVNFGLEISFKLGHSKHELVLLEINLNKIINEIHTLLHCYSLNEIYERLAFYYH